MSRKLRTVLLTVAGCGLILVVAMFLNRGAAQSPLKGEPPIGATGRYQMLTWGAKENPYLVLLDTQTGRSWGMLLSIGKWEDMETPPSQPPVRSDEKPRR